MSDGLTTQQRYYLKNKDTILARNAARRSQGYNLKYNLKPYGLTVEQYDEMRTAQGGRCGICATPTARRTEGHKGIVDQVDHCHTTGKVRGLLCSKCNTALGLLKEDPARVRSLLTYMEKHNG